MNHPTMQYWMLYERGECPWSRILCYIRHGPNSWVKRNYKPIKIRWRGHLELACACCRYREKPSAYGRIPLCFATT